MYIEHPIHSHSRGQRLTERGRTVFYVLASSGGKQMLWVYILVGVGLTVSLVLATVGVFTKIF